MKNSFFKRALASVAAVPLALTQCLTYSFAVADNSIPVLTGDTSYSATVDADKNLSLTSLLNIPADKLESTWNRRLSIILDDIVDTAGGTYTGTIDASAALSLITANTGQYKEMVEAVVNQIGKFEVKCDANGKITLTGEISELSSVLTEQGQIQIDKALANVKAQYGDQADLTALENIDFSSINASGKFIAELDCSGLDASTSIPVSYKIVTENGEYTIAGSSSIFKYVIEKYSAIKSVVEAAVAETFAGVQADLDAAGAKLTQATADLAKAQADLATAKQNGVNVAEAEAELTAKTAELTAAQAQYDEAVVNFKEAGGEAVASLDKVFAGYNKQIEKYGNMLNKYTSVNKNASRTYATTADALAALKNFMIKKEIPKSNLVPASFTAALSKKGAVDVYNNMLTQLNAMVAPYSIDISAAELAAAADALYDINVKVEGSAVTIKASMIDAEKQKL